MFISEKATRSFIGERRGSAERHNVKKWNYVKKHIWSELKTFHPGSNMYQPKYLQMKWKVRIENIYLWAPICFMGLHQRSQESRLLNTPKKIN